MRFNHQKAQLGTSAECGLGLLAAPSVWNSIENSIGIPCPLRDSWESREGGEEALKISRSQRSLTEWGFS